MQKDVKEQNNSPKAWARSRLDSKAQIHKGGLFQICGLFLVHGLN